MGKDVWDGRTEESSSDPIYDLVDRVESGSALGILGLLPRFLHYERVPPRKINTMKVLEAYLDKNYEKVLEKPHEVEVRNSRRYRFFSAICRSEKGRENVLLKMNRRGTKVLRVY